MPNNYEYQTGFEEQDPMWDYLRTMHHGLEAAISDQGKPFEAYLDMVDPSDHVDELMHDYQQRFFGDYTSREEAMYALTDPARWEQEVEALKAGSADPQMAPNIDREAIWTQVLANYEVIERTDGRIYIFNPTVADTRSSHRAG